VVKKAEASFVFPLGTMVAHVARWDTRSAQIDVGGSNSGNAALGIDII
jgi:hypothetical protein